MRQTAQPLTCWVISDGRRGIENQALGLAEGLARHITKPVHISVHTISHKGLFAHLPARFQQGLKSQPSDYGLPDAHPDWVIGCGRQAIAPLMALKNHWKTKIFTVYVQKPYVPADQFDYVVAPEHDGLTGSNVINMIGSPNRITPESLETARQDFRAELAQYTTPRAALLIGGSSKTHTLSHKNHTRHLQAAKDLIAAGYVLLISTSRRTPDWVEADYADLARRHETIWLYSGDADGPNPYMAFLGTADTILVTEDSTNMLVDACATGQSVFRLPMTWRPGTGRGGKFSKLYESLSKRCHVRLFDGNLTAEPYTPLNETARVAEKLWTAYLNR